MTSKDGSGWSQWCLVYMGVRYSLSEVDEETLGSRRVGGGRSEIVLYKSDGCGEVRKMWRVRGVDGRW